MLTKQLDKNYSNKKSKLLLRFMLILMALYFILFLFSNGLAVKAEVPSGNLSDYIREQEERAWEAFGEEGEIPDTPEDEINESDKTENPKVAENAESIEEIFKNQADASGANKLWAKMPDKTREIINNLGINEISDTGITELTPEKIIDQLAKVLSENSGGPLKTMGAMIGIIAIYAFMSAMKETADSSSVTKVFEVICALTASVVLIVPISSCINRVSAATESASVFMLSFVPVYAGIMVTSGQVAMALSYQSVVLFVTELITLASTYFIVPFMTISLSLGLVGSISPEYKINKIGETINKICSWLLGLVSTLFVGLLSLQGFVANSADSLSNRAVRFSLGSFMPIVGGALSEAVLSVQSCLSLLKSTVGGVGILVNALIVIPPIVECALWLLMLSLSKSLSEMFSLDGLTAIFSSVQSVVKTLIAILACCSLFMIVATTIVTKQAVEFDVLINVRRVHK